MKNKFLTSLKTSLWCAAMYAVVFWLLPLCIQDTGSAMLLMLAVLPLVSFCTALLHGLRRGFSLWPAVWAAVLFAPTIWVHYNESAVVYLPVFALLALAGSAVGGGVHRARMRKSQHSERES